MLTTAEQRVLDAIDADALVATLQRLVAVPSIGGTLAELTVQQVAADELRALGLEATTWPLDLAALAAHPAFPGSEVPREAALGLATHLPGTGGGPSLLLNGHLDVVPVGDETLWRYSPWSAQLAEGRVYGRGACDMKGGVAAIIHAAGAIVRSGLRLRGDLHLQTVIGEEDGGLGAFAAALRGPRCDGAIITEPTRMQLVLAQAGALTFRLRVFGRAAHGAMRLEGVSALEAYLPLHQALQHLEQRRNADVAHPLMRQLPLPYPISIGTLHAGDWASTVPEELVVEGRYGLRVGEPIDDARAALEQAIAEATSADPWLRTHPPELIWWGGQFDYAEMDDNHPLAQTLAGVLADQGRLPQRCGVPYGSDMRLFQHIGGTPTLLFGPGDVALAHQRDESILVAELVEATRILALTVMRFLGLAS